MARRIVFVGAKQTGTAVSSARCLEIHADAASALISGKTARVEVAKRAGELSDALTLTFTDDYLRGVQHRLGLGVDLYDRAFEWVKYVLGPGVIREFEVPTPIPFE